MYCQTRTSSSKAGFSLPTAESVLACIARQGRLHLKLASVCLQPSQAGMYCQTRTSSSKAGFGPRITLVKSLVVHLASSSLHRLIRFMEVSRCARVQITLHLTHFGSIDSYLRQIAREQDQGRHVHILMHDVSVV